MKEGWKDKCHAVVQSMETSLTMKFRGGEEPTYVSFRKVPIFNVITEFENCDDLAILQFRFGDRQLWFKLGELGADEVLKIYNEILFCMATTDDNKERE